MNNTDLWATIIGALLPVIISAITQTHWSSQVKSFVALLVCIVAGAITSYYNGSVDWQDIGRTVMLITISAMTFYRNFWKPTGTTKVISSITDVGASK